MNKTKILKIKGDWQDVVDGCRATVNKPPLGHEPSDKFKRDILIAEHEPIREIEIKWAWRNIKYWIAMHWKTHIWPGRTETQRDDRTGVNRDDAPQAAHVTFTGRANPQHLIDTYRKRLCFQAHEQTREYAEDFKVVLHNVEPEISDVLVPNCVYRCGCPELNCCGLWPKFLKWCKENDYDDPRHVTIEQRYYMYNQFFSDNYGESEVIDQ